MIHSGDVEIPVGASLTLLAGVEVVFTGPYRLIVHGELYGYGREDDSVRFTTDTLTNPGRWRGIFAQSAVCSLRYCEIENAQSSAGQNGGGLSATLGRVDLAFCSVRNNSTELLGGGVYGDQCTALNIRDSEVSDNRASNGGAFYCRRTPALVTRCRIIGNLASVSGGGLYGTRSHWLIYRCWIADNRASTSHGGGVRSDSGNVRLFNSVVLRNRAAQDGGGFYCKSDTNDAVLYTNFLADSAGRGAAIYQSGHYSSFTNSIIANNSGGAAVYFEPSNSIEFYYCDVYENSGGNYAGNYPPGLGQLTTNNMLGTPCDSFMNITADAGFQDAANGDLHLSSTSPCIGAAIRSSVDNDFDGDLRPNPAETQPDIGAFESADGPAIHALHGNLRGTLAPNIYVVDGNVTVLANDTLIIPPGTRLYFASNCGMRVGGLLLASGTETDSILFTPFRENPARPGWRGVYFNGCNPACVLDYCTIEDADDSSNVTCVACSPSLNHCLIQKGISNRRCAGLRCLNGANPVLTDCRISRNGVDRWSSAYGGGVYSDHSSPTFNFCRIDSNQSYRGGGIHLYYSNCSFQSSRIDHNSNVLQRSGGIYTQSSTVTLQDCQIDHNVGFRGAGCEFLSSTTTMISSNIEWNSSSGSGPGGGVYIEGTSADFQNCNITNNSGTNGGGCSIARGRVSFVSSVIEANSVSGIGGGLHVGNFVGPVTLDSCIFRNNHSNGNGGGIAIQGSSVVAIRHCTITDNLSTGLGGGVHIAVYTSASDIQIEKSIIHNNSRLGIISEDRTIYVNSSIIANNRGGPGIRFTQRLLTGRALENCDFWGNSGGPIGSPDSLPVGLGVVNSININGDGCDAFGNIFLNPTFVDTAARDLHLMPWSPCINAGDTLLPRDPDSSYSDIGPYWQTHAFAPMQFRLVSPPDGSVSPMDIMRFSWQSAMPPDSQADVHYDLHLLFPGGDRVIASITDTVADVDVGATYPDSALIVWWVMAHCENPDTTSRSLTTWAVRFRPSRIRNISLLSPADQDTVRSDTIRFCWSSSEHPRRPVFIIYQLYLQGSGIDSAFPIQLDTCLRVILRPSSPPQSAWLQWHVTAYSSNPDSSFNSLDTWNFYYERPDAIAPVRELIPTQFALHAAYPNPFNAATTIVYDIPKSGPAKIQIYDITGREVKTVIDGQQEAGQHRVGFNGADLASGIYFVRMEAGSFSQTRKIVLLK
jgi:hypothetical protein